MTFTLDNFLNNLFGDDNKRRQQAIIKKLVRLEIEVADFRVIAQELKDAVAGVSTRLVPQLEQYKSERDALKTAFDEYKSAEDSEDVDQNQRIADLEAAIQDRINADEEAVTSIEQSINELNQIGATDVPSEEEPTNEPTEPEVPVEEPVEDEQNG